MAQTPESVAITKRFFEAMYEIITIRSMRGKQTFTNENDINRWHLITIEKNPETNSLPMHWLSLLIDKYDVSAEWLMTGRGGMFSSLKAIANMTKPKVPAKKATTKVTETPKKGSSKK